MVTAMLARVWYYVTVCCLRYNRSTYTTPSPDPGQGKGHGTPRPVHVPQYGGGLRSSPEQRQREVKSGVKLRRTGGASSLADRVVLADRPLQRELLLIHSRASRSAVTAKMFLLKTQIAEVGFSAL
ncbi:hypothetical protein PoB_006975300 [Plakobranchus ocellatus]|uniref:Secreted protein n=1 Tax=Plakobranchus ocellatus TaxID=259542 RepID=A0AAV4DG39_9GAST|nr:hypothetical protein PoB_006975300 [Plakobranchus ocellatus]